MDEQLISIRELQSENEVDRNLEIANVVDGLFAIARAIDHLAGNIHEVFGSEVDVLRPGKDK